MKSAGQGLSGSGRRRRPGRAWRLVLGLVVAAGLIAAVYVAFGRGGETGDDASSGRIDVSTAQALSFDITTTAMGELEAKNQIELRSELDVSSKIVEIVPEGSRVKKGDVILRLNGEELQRQVDEESLQVESARAELIAAENGLKNQEDENASSIRKAELKVELADLTLEQWRSGDLDKKYTQLKLEIERSTRDLERLTEKYDQSKSLFSQGFLSKNQLDLDEIAWIEASSKLETALLDEEIYWTYEYPRDREQKVSDLREASAELDRQKRTNENLLVSKQAEVEKARQQLKLREERVGKMRDQLAKCAIVAPTDGLVVYSTSSGDFWDMNNRGALQIGREVYPQEALISLPDVSEMVAKVRVHESLGGRIRPGLETIVRVDAMPGEVFRGTVETIGVLAESANWRDPSRREYSVRILLSPSAAAEKLKPAMRAEAEISLGRVDNALAVPIQAIFNDGPVRYVYTPGAGGRYAKTPVKVGRRSGSYAELEAGLDAGARVLLREPTAGEITEKPWDPDQLRVVGLKLNDRGEPVPLEGEGGGPRFGRRGQPGDPADAQPAAENGSEGSAVADQSGATPAADQHDGTEGQPSDQNSQQAADPVAAPAQAPADGSTTSEAATGVAGAAENPEGSGAVTGSTSSATPAAGPATSGQDR